MSDSTPPAQELTNGNQDGQAEETGSVETTPAPEIKKGSPNDFLKGQ